MEVKSTDTKPPPSALTSLMSRLDVGTSTAGLPVEIMFNLQYQHGWTDLRLHYISEAKITDFTPDEMSRLVADTADKIFLISGMPPRHMYIHPDLLNYLIKHNIKDTEIPRPREWVLPTSIGQKWTLRRMSTVFDRLQKRQPILAAGKFQHQDSKRILLGMLSHNGGGGDGTVVYYIMQEGDVKPRQN